MLFSLNMLYDFHKGHFLFDSLSNVMIYLHCTFQLVQFSHYISCPMLNKGLRKKVRRKWNSKWVYWWVYFLRISPKIQHCTLLSFMLFYRFQMTLQIIFVFLFLIIFLYTLYWKVMFKIFLVRTKWMLSYPDAIIISEIVYNPKILRPKGAASI